MTRDIRLLRDLTLSHVLSRDQLLRLGYFDTVTRANTRLRFLRAAGFVKVLPTPFFGQFLYAADARASEVVGARVAGVLASRMGSPRFIQHALMATECRIRLLASGWTDWRFEAQLKRSFAYAGRAFEVRPDAMATREEPHCIEVDLGHVAPQKFREKLLAYDLFAQSGEALRQWGAHRFSVLTMTTGIRRARSLSILVPKESPVSFSFTTFDDLGIAHVGGWS